MKYYQFKLNLIVGAESKAEGKQIAENAYDNLCEMMGYSPFSATLEMEEGDGEEVELEEEYLDADDATWD
jgi:hypothetical protein